MTSYKGFLSSEGLKREKILRSTIRYIASGKSSQFSEARRDINGDISIPVSFLRLYLSSKLNLTKSEGRRAIADIVSAYENISREKDKLIIATEGEK